MFCGWVAPTTPAHEGPRRNTSARKCLVPTSYNWNAGAERMFGYPAGEAPKKPISFVYPEEEQRFVQEQIFQPLLRAGSHEADSLEESFVALSSRASGARSNCHPELAAVCLGE